MLIGVVFNLALLFYFKYLLFFTTEILNINISNDNTSSYLPLGISFFTFQQIAYQIDQKKYITSNDSFIDYALFVSFFPQLIAGPIVHHKDLIPQFTSIKINSKYLAMGLSIFIIGLAKKVIIADKLAIIPDIIYSKDFTLDFITFFDAWLTIFSYSLQIYFDFSGYSDMALGLGYMVGITLPINFSSPYKSCNVTNFWRTWHITLSDFLKQYLYLPLGGNRRGKYRTLLNLFTVMTIGGIWHGAGWTFIAWGCLHGIALCWNKIWNDYFNFVRISHPVSILLTFLFISLTWVLFRAPNIETAFHIFRSSLGINGTSLPYSYFNISPSLNLFFENFNITRNYYSVSYGQGLISISIGLLLVFMCPNTAEIFDFSKSSRPTGHWSLTYKWAIFMAGIFAFSIFKMGTESPFIYYQF